MAATTVLNHPTPTSIFTTPEFYPQSSSAFSNHYTSPHLQSPASPAQPYPSTKSHAPLSRSSLLFAKPADDYESPQSDRPPPKNQAKLHKKAPHPTSRSSQGQTRGAVGASADRRSYASSITDDVSAYQYTSQDNASSSSRSNKLKQNLRKLTTQPKEDPTTIDLSKTAQENEERSGLAIQSASQAASPASPLTGNVTSAGGARHGRSFSGGSAQSASTTAFTPTLPFIHPMRQQESRPHSTSVGQIFQPGSIMGNDYSSTNDLYGLGIETTQNDQQSVTEKAPTARSSASYGTRISQVMDNNSTAAASIRGPSNPTQSQANLSHCSSYTSYTAHGPITTSTTTLPIIAGETPTLSSNKPTTRHTRSTTLANPPSSTTTTSSAARHNRNSHSTTTNPPTTKMARASTFPSLPLSASTTNLAILPPSSSSNINAINAARRAFTEKQEAKSQKYEKAARKAEEKGKRKERRRSSLVGAGVGASPTSTIAGASSPRDTTGTDRDAPKGKGRSRTFSGSTTSPLSDKATAKRTATTKGTATSKNDRTLLSQSYTDLLSASASAGATSAALSAGAAPSGTSPASKGYATPRVSRKRKAKSGYLGVWTWVRVRLLWVGGSK